MPLPPINLARIPLRFGPYAIPRFKIGGKLDCEYASTLRIVAISDAPQQTGA